MSTDKRRAQWREQSRKRRLDPTYRKYMRDYQRSRPKEERADYQLRRFYGLSLEQKLKMMAEQKFKCANERCETMFWGHTEAHVDHHHGSGRIRGILCEHCNRALGLLKDDPELIRSLAQYAHDR